MRFASWVLVVFLSVVPALARADVVMSPPSCPPGQVPVLCHMAGVGQCGAQHCTGDGDCGSGMVCRLRSVCTRTCSRFDGGGVHVRGDILSAECDPGMTCAGSTDCLDEQVCVSSGSGTDGGGGTDAGGSGIDAGGGSMDAGGGTGMDAGPVLTPTSSGGCAVASNERVASAVFLVAAVALIALRRRR